MSLMNKTVFENLIKAGAFDEILKNRAMLLNALPKFLEAIQGINADKKTTQLGLFGDDETDEAVTAEPELPEVEEFDEHTRLEYEKEVTGLYMSGHPYEAYQEKFSVFTNCTITDLKEWKSESIKASAGGIIVSVTPKTTKKGASMCILQLEDTEGSIDAVIFPAMWEKLRGSITKGMACVIEGRMDDRGQFLPDKIISADELDERAQKYVTLKLTGAIPSVREFAKAVNSSRGSARIILEVHSEDEICRIVLGNSVDPERLREAMKGVIPSDSFEIYFGGSFAA